MKKLLIIVGLGIILNGCDDKNQSVSAESSLKKDLNQNTSVSKDISFKLDKFMDLEKICSVISIEKIQQAFSTTAEIRISPASRSYAGRFTCNYSWDRADAEERKQKLLTNIANPMQKNLKKEPMRERILDHNFSITLSEYKNGAAGFVPAKLTEAQLQKRIESAKKIAAKRLTEKQKAIAGDAANDMIVNMIKKSNQNEEVFNVGEAAFWENISSGALNVLVGQTKITVAPMIGENKQEDIENSIKIVNLIAY